MSASFAIAAGGTGGHLFPAEALAAELVRRGSKVDLVTDDRSEAFAGRVPGVSVHRIRAGRPLGSPLAAACGLAGLALGTFEARILLRRLAPNCVIGFGGYPSLPTVFAAASLRLPIILHEQNAVLGRANRLLAPRARRIATAFPEAFGLRPQDRPRAVHTGNPVRPAILAHGERPYVPPDAEGLVALLVIGGSQGAHILSEVVPPAIAALPEPLRRRLRIAEQARTEDLAAVNAAYRADAVSAEVAAFFRDVPIRLESAHLVICRAGASTIAELAAIGRPALLIPYPYATDDHQTANARAFAAAGGGWVIEEAGLTPQRLAREIERLLLDPASLRHAAQSARALGRRDAAQRVAEIAFDLACESANRARRAA